MRVMGNLPPAHRQEYCGATSPPAVSARMILLIHYASWRSTASGGLFRMSRLLAKPMSIVSVVMVA